MQNNIVKKVTDVLVIGGGIAGCMAAIRAREFGSDVTLLEKGNTLRSGSAAMGIDHCWSYIPEIHGEIMSLDDLVDDHVSYTDGMVDRSLIRTIAENSYFRVLDLEKFGVSMRDSGGRFRLQKKIHRCPTFIHFGDRDIKIKLTNAVKKSGAHVENRMMATDLLVERGKVVGVLALSTREGKWYIYKIKTVILCTGGVFRLYRNPNGIAFNISHPPSWSGDGHAMAFKAGARLLNMDKANRHTGPKNFHRAGRGTFLPCSVRDGFGKPLSEYPEQQKGLLAEGAELYKKVLEQGRGPIYMDCTGNTREQNEYIRWALNSECCTSFLNHLDEEGIDLNTDMIEFTYYEPKISNSQQGIEINNRAETTLPGLFAAGTVIGGAQRTVMPGALVMGWIAGENAARLAKDLPVPKFGEQSETVINRRVNIANDFYARKNGSSWQDAQLALQNIMDYYVGGKKSISMLKVGYSNLMQLREQVVAETKVSSPHELFRLMEIMSLIEVGEMQIISAHAQTNIKRKLNPNDKWLKFITVKRDQEKIIVGTRPVNSLHNE